MNIHRHSVGASSRWWEQKCKKHMSRVKDYVTVTISVHLQSVATLYKVAADVASNECVV